MNDTTVTLVGNVATGVDYRETGTGGVARFRFAVTARRWDRERGLWADGHTSFYTVWAWRQLGANLAASVAVGEPLVVHDRLKVREEEREGQRRTSVDIDALAVGHDLTRGTSAFRRAPRAATPKPADGPVGDPMGDPVGDPAIGPVGVSAGGPLGGPLGD
ncbi:single-stranded DNA-binding protein [Streptomyces purpureus]|uniref:single-stranded DNA-binding protein n=1 Tax=Streptomyces purpureus TaxID=1951 RepID=UPI0037948B21